MAKGLFCNTLMKKATLGKFLSHTIIFFFVRNMSYNCKLLHCSSRDERFLKLSDLAYLGSRLLSFRIRIVKKIFQTAILEYKAEKIPL